jgi:NAD(P)-dependent dehydrogenase (short-subunit alcohol dehydrogenase family)
MQNTLASRQFSRSDQLAFASLSGDVNPIHLDPVAARRTVAGQCIVHGMHSLLWALDMLARTLVAARAVRVRFLKPVFLDEEVRCTWDAQAGKLILTVDDIKVVDATLETGSPPVNDIVAAPPVPGRKAPADLTFHACLEFRPRPFELHGNPDLTGKLFPDAARLYGRQTISEIAALSFVVGMEVPGLNSLFSSLRINLMPVPDAPRHFSVVEGDERFNRLAIRVTGRTLQAEIEAFYRPPPVRMPASADLIKRVRSGEHAGVCALVVGGSRGLGEITAKLIAAGGGSVIITYRTGADEANGIADDIQRSGGQCQAIPLTAGEATVLPPDLPAINQLYYFATPKIFGKRTSRFDDALYQKYFSVYVDGFEAICQQLVEHGNRPAILYPSTVAIDKPLPELAEYVKAKSEGEALCRRLNGSGQAAIVMPRLPRTATDQTQALLQVPAEDPVEIMAPLIRQMTELSKQRGSTPPLASGTNAL